MACWSATTTCGANRATASVTPGSIGAASGMMRSSQTNFIAAGPRGGRRWSRTSASPGVERVAAHREDPGPLRQQRPQRRLVAGPGDVVAASGEFRPDRDRRVDVAGQRRDHEQDPAHPTGLPNRCLARACLHLGHSQISSRSRLILTANDANLAGLSATSRTPIRRRSHMFYLMAHDGPSASDGCRARLPHLRLGSRRRNAGSRRPCRGPGSSARDRAAQVHHELTRENARRQEVPAAMLPGPGPHLMRGFATDPSVTKQQLKRGTVRRIAGYARPYRWDLTIFLLAAAAGRGDHGGDPGAARPGHRPWHHPEARRCRAGGRRSRGRAGHLGRVLKLRPALVHRTRRRGPDLRPAHAGVRPRAAAAARVLHPGADRLAGQQAEQRRYRRAAGADLDAGVYRVKHAPADPGAVHDALLLLAGHGHRAVADTRCSSSRPAWSGAGCSG